MPKMLIDGYPELSRYMALVAEIPGVRETIAMSHIREHYFRIHRHINPTGIISIGPIDRLSDARPLQAAV